MTLRRAALGALCLFRGSIDLQSMEKIFNSLMSHVFCKSAVLYNDLDRGSRDEEPFIIHPINWSWWKVLPSWDMPFTRLLSIRRMGNGHVGPVFMS